MKKILIVEDDLNINNLLRDLLSLNGFSPVQAFSGTEAVSLIGSAAFDLILLDLMLPGKTGEEVLMEIRSADKKLPVIVITAVIDKQSVVKLLKAGADDYIQKPFDNSELLARIEARFRNNTDNGANGVNNLLRFREIELNEERFDGFINGEALNLSKREYTILRLLIGNPNKVFTKNNIYESAWESEFLGDDNTVNVHIGKIRAKIAKLSAEEYIQTVWGIGFKMKNLP